MPTQPLPDRIRAFLKLPRYATISTIKPDGSPHQAVIWYGLDGDDLLINSRVERQWPQNLRRDPRVSLAVWDTERPFHWVGLTGRAEPFHEGDAATADIMVLARRYNRDPTNYHGQNRITFRIRIERTYEYGANER